MTRIQTASIQIDPRQLADVQDLLKAVPRGMERALRHAIKRTGNTIKAKTLDVITGELNVKRRDINITPGNPGHRFGGVRFARIRTDGLSGKVSVTGHRIPLFRFGARELGTKKKPRGVTYRISRTGSRRHVRAFIARMRSGHVGVFMRMKKPRFPINEYFGPSIPHVAEKRPAMKRMMNVDASRILEKNLDSQVQYLLSTRKVKDG